MMDEIGMFVDSVSAEEPAIVAEETPAVEPGMAADEASIEVQPVADSTPKIPPIVGMMGMYALGALVTIGVYTAVTVGAKGAKWLAVKCKESYLRKKEEKAMKKAAEEIDPEECVEEE